MESIIYGTVLNKPKDEVLSNRDAENPTAVCLESGFEAGVLGVGGSDNKDSCNKFT